MKMTAAARASMHTMLTLPLSVEDHLTIDANGVVWIYSQNVKRAKDCFVYVFWNELGPAHWRTTYDGIQINVVQEL